MGVHTFPEAINLKVNVIAWLEFELAYYDIVLHINYYAKETLLIFLCNIYMLG